MAAHVSSAEDSSASTVNARRHRGARRVAALRESIISSRGNPDADENMIAPWLKAGLSAALISFFARKMTPFSSSG